MILKLPPDPSRQMPRTRTHHADGLGLLLCMAACTAAFFPDLSGYPSNTTMLLLANRNITDVPAGAFARFTALQTL
jgi:hypothetical protein